MKTLSLRTRLLRSLLFPIAAGILLVGAASCFSTYHEASEVYDAEQVHFAKVLYTLASQMDAPKTVAIEGMPRHDAYERYLTFRVWRADTLLLQSDNAGQFGPVTRTEGFTDRMIGQVRWRFYVERHGNITVEVAEENEVRLDLVRHILAGIFLPQLIILPIVAIIIWFGITRGLAPVERLSALVRKRDANQLSPIDTQGVPNELVTMVDAINDLMRRVGDAMRVEKYFTNYAAHEMRTPIAALKTQAQVILRTSEPKLQKQMVQDLLETVSRTQRIVEQLLTYARVQHAHTDFTRVGLSTLVLDELREAAPKAIEKGLAFEHDVAEGVAVPGQEELLRLTLRNLIDNAIKYTAQGVITLTLHTSGEGAQLDIIDTGTGIPTDSLPHIFDPFYRVTGAAATGAGLGLAIVKWACDVQHITLGVYPNESGQGMRFTLHFPAQESDA